MHETLDSIADAFIPILGIVLLGSMGVWAYRRRWDAVRDTFLSLAVMLALVYAIMWLDAALTLWPRVGLDYSTHTALSLALVLILARIRPPIVWWVAWVAYLALMLYQRYHSLADMLTTSIVIASAWWILNARRRSRHPSSGSGRSDVSDTQST